MMFSEKLKNFDVNINKPLLYGFTPDKYLNGRNIIDVVEQQLRGGVDIIQLREKKMGTRNLFELAKQIKIVARKYKKIFIVNDDILIAKLSDADGVHLGQDDIDVSTAREFLGAEKIIGLSTHNLQQYIAGQSSCADYTAVGPVFATATKDNPAPTVGIEKLTEILSFKKKFSVAIGGINQNNIDEILKFPFDSIAIVSAIVALHDTQSAAEYFKNNITYFLQ